MNKQIYLDYNATVPVLEKVKKSLVECLNFGPLNASSIHYYGRKSKTLVENAKFNIARLINTNSENIIFTSSATEAINLLFSNFNTIVVSSIEHLAVLSSSKSNLIIPVDKNGVVDLNYMETLLKNVEKNGREILVSVMWVNNETGVIQPIKEVISIARKYGCLVHCDAAQALGKIEINLNELQIDFLTLSGHKIGAPTGIGALINHNNFFLAPQILGGGQEKGMRAGTENMFGILGFGEAALIMLEMPKKNITQVKYLRDYLIKKIKKIKPETIFFGQNSNRVSNTLLMALPNTPGDLALMTLDLASFSVSSGSACSSGKISKSHVVSAMGYDDLAFNSIRLSFPPNDTILESEGLITIEELDNLAECWLGL